MAHAHTHGPMAQAARKRNEEWIACNSCGMPSHRIRRFQAAPLVNEWKPRSRVVEWVKDHWLIGYVAACPIALAAAVLWFALSAGPVR